MDGRTKAGNCPKRKYTRTLCELKFTITSRRAALPRYVLQNLAKPSLTFFLRLCPFHSSLFNEVTFWLKLFECTIQTAALCCSLPLPVTTKPWLQHLPCSLHGTLIGPKIVWSAHWQFWLGLWKCIFHNYTLESHWSSWHTKSDIHKRAND